MTLQTELIRWFQKNRRPLPWRKHYHPYEVWVSEIMLQQTQVETALPYFKRWMKSFPTLRALARSPAKKVLKHWQGLGYYSRARNLHRNAKLIVKQYRGIFPSDYETLLSLKGIGPYTAGAIASIAFNQNRPIVDGNILRVLARLYRIALPIDEARHQARFWELQEKLLVPGRARDFNQGLMELGALVCTAQNPRCALCPVRTFCRAYAKKEVYRYPVRLKKKTITKVEASSLVLTKAGRYLLQKRPLGEIMGGLWEFPEWKLSRGEKLPLEEVRRRTRERAREEFGLELDNLRYLDAVKRNYTHHNETLRVFKAELSAACALKTGNKKWPSVWATEVDFARYPFSSAHSKIAKIVTKD